MKRARVAEVLAARSCRSGTCRQSSPATGRPTRAPGAMRRVRPRRAARCRRSGGPGRAAAWPRTSPSRMCRSVRQTPQACTRRAPRRGPGTGSGSSRACSGGRARRGPSRAPRIIYPRSAWPRARTASTSPGSTCAPARGAHSPRGRARSFQFGERASTPSSPRSSPVPLDVSRMTGGGYSLRLRFAPALAGPCMRCLEEAAPSIDVDAREVDQPGGGEELESPYVEDDELDLGSGRATPTRSRSPTRSLCRADCAGLCPECGANLNTDPGHAHERRRSTRAGRSWGSLI